MLDQIREAVALAARSAMSLPACGMMASWPQHGLLNSHLFFAEPTNQPASAASTRRGDIASGAARESISPNGFVLPLSSSPLLSSHLRRIQPCRLHEGAVARCVPHGEPHPRFPGRVEWNREALRAERARVGR
jgi:hypothetical protein